MARGIIRTPQSTEAAEPQKPEDAADKTTTEVPTPEMPPEAKQPQTTEAPNVPRRSIPAGGPLSPYGRDRQRQFRRIRGEGPTCPECGADAVVNGKEIAPLKPGEKPMKPYKCGGCGHCFKA